MENKFFQPTLSTEDDKKHVWDLWKTDMRLNFRPHNVDGWKESGGRFKRSFGMHWNHYGRWNSLRPWSKTAKQPIVHSAIATLKEGIRAGERDNRWYLRDESVKKIEVKGQSSATSNCFQLEAPSRQSQTCFMVAHHLTRKRIERIPQLPYSPDVVSADFFLFPKVKTNLERMPPQEFGDY